MSPNEKHTERSWSKIALLQGFVFVFLSLFAGLVCPLLTCMVYVPDGPASWQVSVLLNLHWHWTLPVGIVLAILTIWITSKLPEKAKAAVCFFTSMVLLAFAVFITWLMLSV